MSEIILRPATVDDAAAMLAIYAPYVIQTTVSSEYDAPTLEEFTRRIRTFTEKLPWLVCIIDGEVAGYGYASPHRTRAAYQWSVETSIYVAQVLINAVRIEPITTPRIATKTSCEKSVCSEINFVRLSTKVCISHLTQTDFA